MFEVKLFFHQNPKEMESKRLKPIIGVGVIILLIYAFYNALPMLVAFTSNILVLSGFLVFGIIGLIAIFYFIRWLFK